MAACAPVGVSGSCQTAMDDHFSSEFRALTRDGVFDGYEPLRWQRRLFKRFCENDVPKTCDLPTGLGKTSVIYVWLLALRQQIAENKPRLPTRLVYVVDRRTVVDQATELAERAKRNLSSLGPPCELSVSTLRGQFADNREWTIDPSRPAIIIGTVDMIGSRLLFSGYRSSYRLRPLDAGLLGQDTLLVLDEAHLSEPFAMLIRALCDQGEFQRGQGLPMRVMCMSATTAGGDSEPFKLEPCDLEGTAEENPIVRRYEAQKWLTIHPTADRKAAAKGMIEAAASMTADNSRVVVFVRRPDDAAEIADGVRKKLKLFPDAIEVLTGTMRGLERDELVERPVLKRFLDGEEKPEERAGKGPAILVSTSAGEVGFDLNADHMLCDAAPLDSMIQRLGRVNRRGYRNAVVQVFPEVEKSAKKGASEKPKHAFESAVAAAMECLEKLQKNDADGTYNASPKALDELRTRIGPVLLDTACAPKPAAVELTDILLDAWSMTTIAKPMPGRPPVAAWLRGVEAGRPETTIAWRAELDLDGFEELDPDDVEEWFDAHRILPHETLSVPTERVKSWILERWNTLPDRSRDAVGERHCAVDRTGLQLLKLRDLVEELEQKHTKSSIDDAQIVLPASFGGIDRGEGLLVASKPNPDAPDSWKSPDVADVPGGGGEERSRYRVLRTVDEDGERDAALVGEYPNDRSGLAFFELDLPFAGDLRMQLVSLVPKRRRPEFGMQEQTLSNHVELVAKNACDICDRLALLAADPVREAVELAARWHDHGKKREIWQRAAGHQPGNPPLGKSGGRLKRVPGNYRHEFGSLREFIDEHEGKIPDHVFDLALHLVATHHGRARPHFPKGGFDPTARAKSPQIAADVIRRFAQLQRKYGYWQLAWLENLLRCADAMASAEK